MERGSCRTEQPFPMLSGAFTVFADVLLGVLAGGRGLLHFFLK